MKIDILGKIVGSSAMYIGNTYSQVTLVKLYDSIVFETKTYDKHGYDAIKVSTGDIVSDSKLKKPQLAQIKKMSLVPRKSFHEIRYPNNSLKELNLTSGLNLINPDAIKNIVGLCVDVKGKTKGKGFSGWMKRHGFSGTGDRSCDSLSHRSGGATGSRQDPGKVFKNKKMPGHEGSVNVTVKNLKVVQYDTQNNILVIKGCIPGTVNSNVLITNPSNLRAKCDYTVLNNISLKAS